ncbi:Maf family protein [Paenibacillus sp. GCM10027626]|uniref:Maf family protein n=1 Tax=Paenibacillus sp. GCM10027626 TaxID=3273411 RepID=UPI003635BE4B
MGNSFHTNPINIRQIVLASSSPRRRELVASLGLSLPVLILSTNADEETPADWSPSYVVEQLALRKANAAIEQLQGEHASNSVIIGADTIVVLDGQILGKPADAADAVSMLTALQGREHEVYTGVATIGTADMHTIVRHRMTRVSMKPMNQWQIERYVATGEPMDKAGSYAIQGIGATNVDKIAGCYFNVVGLSLSLLADMLGEYGITPY